MESLGTNATPTTAGGETANQVIPTHKMFEIFVKD